LAQVYDETGRLQEAEAMTKIARQLGARA